MCGNYQEMLIILNNSEFKKKLPPERRESSQKPILNKYLNSVYSISISRVYSTMTIFLVAEKSPLTN